MTETAILAGGCFWCTEAVFQRLKGITKVTSGYIGGDVQNPTYEQVSTGTSGHAEAIKVEFDPTKINYEQLLDVFWKAHDPTTANRQGADVGPQYRSAIFYLNDGQKKRAEDSLKKAQKEIEDKIVTEICPANEFYKAEDYHQNFYNNNKSYGYCRTVIDPKLRKLFK